MLVLDLLFKRGPYYSPEGLQRLFTAVSWITFGGLLAACAGVVLNLKLLKPLGQEPMRIDLAGSGTRGSAVMKVGYLVTHTHTRTHTHTERDKHAQTHAHTHTHTHTHRERETYTRTHKHRERERERETYTQEHGYRHTHTHTHTYRDNTLTRQSEPYPTHTSKRVCTLHDGIPQTVWEQRWTSGVCVCVCMCVCVCVLACVSFTDWQHSQGGSGLRHRSHSCVTLPCRQWSERQRWTPQHRERTPSPCRCAAMQSLVWPTQRAHMYTFHFSSSLLQHTARNLALRDRGSMTLEHPVAFYIHSAHERARSI